MEVILANTPEYLINMYLNTRWYEFRLRKIIRWSLRCKELNYLSKIKRRI